MAAGKLGVIQMNLNSLYSYKATVIRILDGDSVVLSADLGFKVFIEIPVRLAHIDTPELRSSDEGEAARAMEAKQKLIELLADPNVIIRSFKPFKGDKFGRWLVEIINSQGVNVNQMLLDLGLAVPYEGKKKASRILN